MPCRSNQVQGALGRTLNPGSRVATLKLQALLGTFLDTRDPQDDGYVVHELLILHRDARVGF